MVMDDLLVSFDCLVNSVLPLSLNERVSFYPPLCKKGEQKSVEMSSVERRVKKN